MIMIMELLFQVHNNDKGVIYWESLIIIRGLLYRDYDKGLLYQESMIMIRRLLYQDSCIPASESD